MKPIIKDMILLLVLFVIIIIRDNYINKYKINSIIKTSYSYELKKTLDDYNNLKSIHNLTTSNNLKCISKIKYQNMNNFYKFVNINNNCNIKKGDIVLNEYGLYGIVDKTSKNNARVKLLSNEDSSISIVVNNNYGSLVYKNGNYIVEDLSGSNIKIGDIVYTSGLTNIPPDIKIGKILSYSKEDNYYIVGVKMDHANPFVAVLEGSND